MYVRAGRPAFARPYVRVHRNTSLMSSPLLLEQCPACLVRLTWIVFVMGGRWPYSRCFVEAILHKMNAIKILIFKKKQYFLHCNPKEYTNMSSLKKVLVNLEKDVSLYSKVKTKLRILEYWCEMKPNKKRKKCIFTFRSPTAKSFLFVFNILDFAHRTRINNSFILNNLIDWAVNYCGGAISYFLLADNSGCYIYICVCVSVCVYSTTQIAVSINKQSAHATHTCKTTHTFT